MRLTRRDALRAGGAALACAVLPAHVPGHAQEAAPFETINLDWVDATRQRPVPVRLYLPTNSPTNLQNNAQRVPLLVFSHGIGGSRAGYSWLGQHVARRGIASLHLQHVGSDRTLWSGSVWGLVGRLGDAAKDTEAIARVQDFRFALDTLLAGELAGRIDTTRIVAAGHSYGANTTLLASGARVPREGRMIDLHDARVRAAVVISAPPFYGEAEPAKILASVAVPSLHVTCTEDVIRIPGYYSGVEDRLKVFEATGGPRGPNKWLAVYEGGSHSMFTDRGGTGGVALNPQVKQATQALVLAFVRGVFDGDETGLRSWPLEHAALLARFQSPPAGA